MNKQEVIQLLATIQVAFPNFHIPNKDIAVNLWHRHFADIPSDAVIASLDMYISQNNAFAPSIGALKSLLFDATNNVTPSTEAWAMVHKAICNGIYHSEEEFAKLPPTIQKAVGSPANIREWAQTESKNMTVIESNFMRTYESVVKREKQDALMPQSVRLAVNKVMGIEEKKDE